MDQRAGVTKGTDLHAQTAVGPDESPISETRVYREGPLAHSAYRLPFATGNGTGGAGRGAPLALPMTATADGLWLSDWAPLLPLLLDGRRPVTERAAVFHASLADTLLRQARQARARHGVNRIAFSGGVFQNRILTEQACRWLENDGFQVNLSADIPVNDAGLSYGQVLEYAMRLHRDIQ